MTAYTEEAKKRALNEASEKIGAVIAPTSIVYFKIAEPSFIKLVTYLDIKDGYDKQTAQNVIKQSVKTYINSIAPGDSLYVGDINRLGLNVEGVEYFNVRKSVFIFCVFLSTGSGWPSKAALFSCSTAALLSCSNPAIAACCLPARWT